MLDPLVLARHQPADLGLLPALANRHGLITGATGTGKTITLQVLAERFSSIGVPVFMADVKGDLSGLSAPGEDSAKLRQRLESLGVGDWAPARFPVAFWDVTGKQGHPVRATISDMGPILLARLLNLNDVQAGVLQLVFKIADDQGLLLLDLKDLRAMVAHVGEHAREFTTEYGNVSAASIGAIQRGLLSLGEQGGETFFGEPMLDIADLMQTDNGQGIVNILAADQLMSSPRLYSTFLLWLLSELFEQLPEVGDLDKPKLVFFFDEAHLLFETASKTLLDQIEQTARLIRSKGVGVFFITQVPIDVPSSVLAQLGNRVQHALRVFTPEDSDNLRKTVRTFPMTSFFDVGERLTSLGIGEAMVTVLSPNGVPTPLAPTRLVPPDSSMSALPPDQLQARARAGALYAKYAQPVDPQSAHEIISARIVAARAVMAGGAGVGVPPTVTFGGRAAAAQARAAQKELERANREIERQASAQARRDDAERRAQERASERAARQRDRAITQVGTTVLRGVFGTLFGGSRRRR